MNNIKDVMKIDVNNLKKTQFDALKTHATCILQTILDNLKLDNFEFIESMTEFSPAGDGMGTDKSFINFNFSDDPDGNDICEILENLKSLKGIK